MADGKGKIAGEIAARVAPVASAGFSSWFRRQVYSLGIKAGLLTAGTAAIIYKSEQLSKNEEEQHRTVVSQRRALETVMRPIQEADKRDLRAALEVERLRGGAKLSPEDIRRREAALNTTVPALPAEVVAHNHRLGISLSVVDGGNSIRIQSQTRITGLALRATMGVPLNSAKALTGITLTDGDRTVVIPALLLGNPRAAQIVVTNELGTGGINLDSNVRTRAPTP